MGEKNKKNEHGGENKKKENSGGSDDVTVVLKADFHCEGCISKVVKSLRSLDGVDTVSIGEGQKIIVVGQVDPAKLREKVEQKTHKKVELISPQPKKDNNAKGKENSGGNAAKQDKKKESNDNSPKEKSDEKKSKGKEPPVTTAVMKVHLHCEGCVQKIYKTVTKTKGYQEIKFDQQKDLVIVTGAMDMKAVAEALQKQLKKDVEIVPLKKEGGKKEKEGGGDKAKSGGGGGDAGGDGGDGKMEGNRMQSQPFGYPYHPYMHMQGPGFVPDQFQYNPYPSYQYHAPQIFSDENPNACSVM